MSGAVVGTSRILLTGGVLVVAALASWGMRKSPSGSVLAVADAPRAETTPARDSTIAPSSLAIADLPAAASASPTTEDAAAPAVAMSKQSRTASEVNQQAEYPVTIRKPVGTPRTPVHTLGASAENSADNNLGTVACSTCHATRRPNLANRRTADLDEFHQNVTIGHGNLTCLSCHNPDDYDTLHLADGSSVAYSDVMTLCGQCHGRQTRDYQHGAHGGMTGYWDLSRGPRMRLNCVDCHAPHAPRFPSMVPTFKPRDRFLSAAESSRDEKVNRQQH